MLAKQMADNQTTPDDSGSSDKQEPEYSFEGFTIDFSDKVMLTPARTEDLRQQKCGALMDEAFMSFEQIVERMLAFTGEVHTDDNSMSTKITACEIETPVELDVYRDEQGGLHIGTTPPLYYTKTTFLPSFHRLKFKAYLSNEDADGN